MTVHDSSVQSSGAVRTGRWAWALIPYPRPPPPPPLQSLINYSSSLINYTVSVDVEYHERRRMGTKACSRTGRPACYMSEGGVGWVRGVQSPLLPTPALSMTCLAAQQPPPLQVNLEPPVRRAAQASVASQGDDKVELHVLGCRMSVATNCDQSALLYVHRNRKSH